MTRSRQTADWGSRAGLAKIVPSSVAVGSGTGSADSFGTVTFTGCSSVSLNDVFSATYTNYRIIARFSYSVSSSISLRLRVSNADASGANYARYGIVTGASSNNARINSASETSAILAQPANPNSGFVIGEILSPQIAVTTFMNFSNYEEDKRDYTIQSSNHNLQTSYTGFTLFPSSGNMTGTINVLGYN
jgi:hypothetical protein